MATNEETTINLLNDVTVNGKTYKAGQQVAVPKTQADDVARIDFEASEQERLRNVRRTSNVNLGTRSVGNGAE